MGGGRAAMTDPRAKYEAALAAFAAPGARWANKGALTYWGKAAGLTDDEIVADARAAGVADRDADIRRGWADARPRGDRPKPCGRPNASRARPKPQTFPRFVRDMVAAGGGEAASADLRALSPVPVPKGGAAQTAAFLRALYDPADLLFVFREDPPTAGRPGESIMTCADWLLRIGRGAAMPGDLIVPNPFTGAQGETTGGRKSYVAQSCLARLPFAVAEFDAMPLKGQAAFWRGLLTASALAPLVAALTYSGGKSIHGLLHVGCADRAGWEAKRAVLASYLAADPDPAYRADAQAMRPRTGTRLAGVRRLGGEGRTQGLLYLNPEAVRPRAADGRKVLSAACGNAPGGTIARFHRATEGACADARERPQERAAPQTCNQPPEATERATGRISAAPRDSAPPRGLPPTIPQGDAPLDDLLAALDVAEAWEAAGGALR